MSDSYPIKEISGTQDYVRAKLDEAKIAELATILKHEGTRWPFPPILIRPKKIIVKPKGKPERVYIYEVVDGNKRLIAATDAGRTQVPADVHEFSDADAFLTQVVENASHGVPLTKDERDSAVLKLRQQFKLPMAQIAKAWGLSEASVSRICSGGQRVTPKKRKAGKARGGRAKAKADRARAQSPEAWKVMLRTFLHAVDDQKFLAFVSKLSDRTRAALAAALDVTSAACHAE